MVLRTLEKEPSQRYQQASDVKTAVQEAGEHRATASPASANPATVRAEEVRRLRVPFTIDDVYAGFAKATGSMRLAGQSIHLEFQVHDDVVGYVRSSVKSVTIPLSEIISIRLLRQWFGLRHSLEIMTEQLRTLEDVPHSEQGRATLRIASRDLPQAQRLVKIVQRVLGDVPTEPSGQTFDRIPPVVQPVASTHEQEVKRAVRGPAIGLLTVGILDCLAPFLLLLAMTAVWSETRVTSGGGTDFQVAPNVEIQTSPPGMPLRQQTVVRIQHDQNHLVRSGNFTLGIAFIMWGFVLVFTCSLAVLIILGAIRMKRLDGYGLGITACIAALLPIHPWFIVGLPIGIWGLVVLAKRETKDVFQTRRRFVPSARHAEEPSIGKPPMTMKPSMHMSPPGAGALRPPGISLLILGGLNVVLAILAFLMLAMHGHFRTWAAVGSLVPGVAGLLQLLAGLHLLRNRSYTMAMVGTGAALLPLTPLWSLTFPCGVWTLVVLLRRGSRQAFEHTPQPSTYHPDQGRRRSRIVLLAFLVAGLLVGGVAAKFVVTLTSPPPPINSPSIIVNEQAKPAQIRSRPEPPIQSLPQPPGR